MNDSLKKFVEMVNEEMAKAKPKAAPEIIIEEVQQQVTEIVESTPTVIEESGPAALAARLTRKVVDKQPKDPLTPLDQKFVTLKDMNDHYSLFLQRIQQQLSSLGGGGEVKFARLDDVTASTAGLNKFLTYNSSTRKFNFDVVGTAGGISLNSNNQVTLLPATSSTLGGFKLGPGVALNGLDQLIIDPTGLDFSFGDFYAYVANGASGTPAAFFSSLHPNEDIVIQSNGNGQVDIIGKFGVFPVDGPLDSRDPVFSIDDLGNVSSTTLRVVNTSDLGLTAPLNVTINEQGLTKTPAIVTGSVAQFTGRDNRAPLIVLDSYGVDATRNITGGEYTFRTGRGTNAIPAPLQKDDIIGNVTAAGWANTSGYGGIGVGGLRIVADENFTTSSRGSRVEIYTTPKGTISPTRIVTVDNIGMTFNPNDVTGIVNVDYVVFDKTHVNTANTEGTIAWNTDDDTLDIRHADGVTQQVGQELYMRARNRTGSTITNGSVVRFAGAEQDISTSRLLITPFQGNGQYPNLYGVGVATQDIVDGADGLITVWGKVHDLDTSSWNIGDILYVSPVTAGRLTNVKPTAPNNVIPIAAVVKKSSTSGEIFVRPTIEQRYIYGSFSDTQGHVASAADTPYAIPLNTTSFSSGVSVDVSDNTKVVTSQSGLFNFQFTVQFMSTNSAAKDVYIWARKNGTDIPNSATRLSIVGNGVYAVASWNFIVSMGAGDHFQLMWAATDVTVGIVAPAATSFAPGTPSTILTVTQVAQ